MAIDVEKIRTFLSNLTLEQIYNSVFIFIVLLILILASIALYGPVTTDQTQQVRQLASQQRLPQTQDMALALLEQRPIYRGQYLKLMQAYQQESVRAHQLPAVDADQPEN
ncbi:MULTISPECIES: hypothetical protein [Acinetobacter]|uniref:hypothetical protein n=1 Tax=Acinetobacter TaxID=469 RepID=UPI0005370D4C|nr:hypothetical protein [Acinetobacter sp. HR7]KGT48801.1 hypothetical protein GW12_01350 [Acinetobacter sp. HR7]